MGQRVILLVYMMKDEYIFLDPQKRAERFLYFLQFRLFREVLSLFLSLSFVFSRQPLQFS